HLGCTLGSHLAVTIMISESQFRLAYGNAQREGALSKENSEFVHQNKKGALTQKAFARLVKDALAHFYDISHLQTHPLGDLLIADKKFPLPKGKRFGSSFLMPSNHFAQMSLFLSTALNG
ncbi:MAG: hypothetical protein J7M05_09020, partial [Anaerolineae bacterium]|nr:hypothetical protein [Anaerolineae bacterium]